MVNVINYFFNLSDNKSVLLLVRMYKIIWSYNLVIILINQGAAGDKPTGRVSVDFVTNIHCAPQLWQNPPQVRSEHLPHRQPPPSVSDVSKALTA